SAGIFELVGKLHINRVPALDGPSFAVQCEIVERFPISAGVARGSECIPLVLHFRYIPRGNRVSKIMKVPGQSHVDGPVWNQTLPAPNAIEPVRILTFVMIWPTAPIGAAMDGGIVIEELESHRRIGEQI